MANKINYGNLENMLERLCGYTLEQIKEADSEEQFAYMLGMFEVATALYGSVATPGDDIALVSICGDYEKTKQRFHKWAKETNPNYSKQMRLDKMFKSVFETLDGAPSKPNTRTTKAKANNEEA